jgi:hypothetical protein
MQKSHAPEHRRLYNKACNKLKAALHAMRNASFAAYVSTLKRDDNSIWKPLKSRKNPQTPLPPIRKNSTPPGPWAKSDLEKAQLFANHLGEVFTPYDNNQDPEVEREIATPIQPSDTLRVFTLSELKDEIKMLNPHRAPGIDLITARMIKELPHEGLLTLLYILNAIRRIAYWPASFKLAKIIMIPKPGKNPTDVASYRPISLLPIISKILEKLILKRIYIETNPLTWIPQHQFGFRKAHSTTQQCHRITDIINKALEDRQYCTAVFLDVSQAFDKVWHQGLLLKIKQTLPSRYFKLLQSYLQDRSFVATYKNETSTPLPMLSGVPQGSILGPLLYTIYTADLPKSNKTILSTFADDTAIFTIHPDPAIASQNLQDHLHNIETWTRKWKLKINEHKSSHITFSLRRGRSPPVYINREIIPQTEPATYLGFHLDKRLTWKNHIAKKRKQLDLKTRDIQWLIGRHSPLTLDNKILIYKAVLKPVWTYGIELWGCATKSNIAIIQRYQSKILRTMTNAPWYVTNLTLHSDLPIPFVRTVFQESIAKYRETLTTHPNPLIEPLLQSTTIRRLKRRWTLDGTH